MKNNFLIGLIVIACFGYLLFVISGVSTRVDAPPNDSNLVQQLTVEPGDIFWVKTPRGWTKIEYPDSGTLNYDGRYLNFEFDYSTDELADFVGYCAPDWKPCFTYIWYPEVGSIEISSIEEAILAK